MATTTLVPTGITDTGSNVASGAATDIDNTIASANDSALVTTITDQFNAGTVSFALSDLPGDFSSVNTVQFRTRARFVNPGSGDQGDYVFTLTGSNLPTTTTATWSEADDGAGFANRGAGSAEACSASEANINAWTVVLSQAGYSKDKSPDGFYCDISEIEVIVDYNAGGSNNTEEPLEADPPLALQGYAPSAEITHNRAVGVAEPALQGYAPSAVIDRYIDVPTTELHTVTFTGLFLNGQAPTIVVTVDSGNVEEPGAGSLTLTPTTPSIGISISVPSGSLSIASDAPSAEIVHTKSPNVVQLVFNSDTIAPIVGVARAPPVGGLELAADAASAEITHNRSVPAGNLSFSSDAPTVLSGLSSAPGADGLVLDGLAPSAEIAHSKSPGTVALGLAGIAPNAVNSGDGALIEVPHTELHTVTFTGLFLNGQAPTISVTGGVTVEPTAGSLALSGQTPTIGTSAGPTADSLTISGQQPALLTGIGPGAGSLVFGSNAPSAEISVTETPSAGAVAINSDAPLPLVGFNQQPTTGALVLASDAASAEIAHSKSPGIAALALAGIAPNAVNTSDGDTIEVPAGELHTVTFTGLQLKGQAPTISVTGAAGETVEPGAGSLTLNGAAPTLGVSTSPAAGSLTINGLQPALFTEFNAAPSTVGLALAGAAPSAEITHNRGVGAGSLTLSGQQASIASPQAVSPTVGGLAIAGAAPSVVIGDIASPSAGSLALTGIAPSAEFDYYPVVPTGSLTFASTAAEADLEVTPAGSLDIASDAPVVLVENSGVAIVNAQATTDVPNNYEQCDYSGFRQLPGSLKFTWKGYGVRRKSYEERHPQENVRSVPEKLKGPRRPEQDDRFIGDDIDEITGDDL